MKEIIIAVSITLIVGTIGGYLAGHRYASNKCETETLRVQSETSTAIAAAVVEAQETQKQVAAADAARTAGIEREFAELRRNYEALKKARVALKSDRTESTQSDDRAAAHINIAENLMDALYETNIPIADDLPVSDELRDYRNSAIHTLLRAN